MLVRKLLGEDVKAQDRLEEKVCGLIDVIEQVYPCLLYTSFPGTDLLHRASAVKCDTQREVKRG